MTSIGIQVLAITALVLTFLLVCYTVYIRVRQSTFTEKRFNFVALWSCSAVALLALHAVVSIPIIESVLARAGLSISPPDALSKAVGAKVLFTGRPNFFLDDEELKRALGISEGVAVGPYCSALRIAPFEPDQIAGTLRWMSAEKVQAFMQAV